MLLSIQRAAIVASLFATANVNAQSSPLPSWNDGSAKQAILDFVRVTTDKSSPQFVPPAERIATFDNDGTLWVEHPFYTQGVFALDRVVATASQHPEWKTTEPFKSVLAHDQAAIEKFSAQDFEKIVAETHSGMRVGEFQTIVSDWLSKATDKRYKRHYTELVYQPMIELMSFLRANGYKTYIVTGGGQAFVRAFAERVYGVPPEQVIGSAGRTKYGYGADGQPVLSKTAAVLFVDDKGGKPEGIDLIIGRLPRAAFGNSDGDRQMLEWTKSGTGARLAVLVHHDDAQREYAYGPATKVGTFSDSLMAEATKRGWTVISMKNDWRRIFPFDPP